MTTVNCLLFLKFYKVTQDYETIEGKAENMITQLLMNDFERFLRGVPPPVFAFEFGFSMSYFQWICIFVGYAIFCSGYATFCLVYKIVLKPFPSGHMVHTFQVNGIILAKDCMTTTKCGMSPTQQNCITT